LGNPLQLVALQQLLPALATFFMQRQVSVGLFDKDAT
jgi:hypothetical protein